MRKIFIIITALSIALSLSACAGKEKVITDDKSSENIPAIVINKSTDKPAMQTEEVKNNQDNVDASSNAEIPDEEKASETPTIFEGDFSGVMAEGVQAGIIYSSDEKNVNLSDDEGNEYLVCEYEIPHIEIKENIPAAAAITDYINSSVTSFETNIDIMAAEAESFMQMEELSNPYGIYSSFTPTRLDKNIISLREYASSYTGGAHPANSYTGYNFDSKTGKLLTLSSIADDTTRFKESAKSYILDACRNLPDEYQLFDDYENSIDSMFNEGNWYITDHGVVFIASEYLLAPYAVGSLEFEVPYSQLDSIKPSIAK